MMDKSVGLGPHQTERENREGWVEKPDSHALTLG